MHVYIINVSNIDIDINSYLSRRGWPLIPIPIYEGMATHSHTYLGGESLMASHSHTFLGGVIHM